MPAQSSPTLLGILRGKHNELLEQWLALLSGSFTARTDVIRPEEFKADAKRFLELVTKAVEADGLEISGAGYAPVKDLLSSLSASRARAGVTPAETAMFVFSLKQPLFALLNTALASNPQALASESWAVSELLDRLGLQTVEAFQQTREEIIARQQQELLELSTPVVQLWQGVLALPLIGTLDSARTQVVMENLLQEIVRTGAGIAIIDITGVPTVDTLVAQHLLKTVAAARLMGADCIISGIRPQIAQTIVHLGVDLQDVITKASIADAFAIALQRTGLAIVRLNKHKPAEA